MIRFISTVFLVATRTQHATVRSMGSKFEAIVYVKQAELWIDICATCTVQSRFDCPEMQCSKFLGMTGKT